MQRIITSENMPGQSKAIRPRDTLEKKSGRSEAPKPKKLRRAWLGWTGVELVAGRLPCMSKALDLIPRTVK